MSFEIKPLNVVIYVLKSWFKQFRDKKRSVFTIQYSSTFLDINISLKIKFMFQANQIE